MEQRTKKPYRGIKCELFNYTKEAVMFTLSGTDVNGISLTTVAAYESALRMIANGDANGGRSYISPSTVGGFNVGPGYNTAYYYDPLLGYDGYNIPGCEGSWATLPFKQFMLDQVPNSRIFENPLGGRWARGEAGALDASSLQAFATSFGCTGTNMYGYSTGPTGNACNYCC